MAHQFAILIDGKVQVFDNYDDIPETFENVIRFEPEVPPEPHTEEQHHEIEQWNDKLQQLLRRETR
jgi:hypothetical protein|tara:strand:- start:702 stop:899 length:198 start_codon:yes stop_codon:yes gene_type:complete